jgi:hypothetical protein
MVPELIKKLARWILREELEALKDEAITARARYWVAVSVHEKSLASRRASFRHEDRNEDW